MFTDNQKKIVQQILEGKVNDLFSFIFENKLDKREKTEGYREDEYKKYEKLNNARRREFKEGMGKMNIIDFENSFKLLIDYFYVIRKSKKNELLSFGQRKEFSGKDIFDVSDGSRKYEKQIDNLNTVFNNYEDCEFYPNPELNYFVDRGYLTEEEFYKNEEDKDRKVALKEDEFYKKEEDKDRKASLRQSTISQRWTIGISVGIFVIGTIINIFIYTKDRDVNIKNYKDTTKVIVVEPQKIVNDSLQINKDK
jgi:hypothetical protein